MFVNCIVCNYSYWENVQVVLEMLLGIPACLTSIRTTYILVNLRMWSPSRDKVFVAGIVQIVVLWVRHPVPTFRRYILSLSLELKEVISAS